MIRISEIVSSTLGAPRHLDWQHLEGELGFGLPRDYREIVESYGPGMFSDFIFLFEPIPDNPHIYIGTQNQLAIDALRYLQERGDEEIPYQLTPFPEIVGCGRTVNGDMLYWRTRELDDPETWTIVGNEARGPDWFEYEGGLDSFLTACISGEYEFPFLWEDGELEAVFSPFGNSP